MRVKMLVVAEVDVDEVYEENPREGAIHALDSFRESVRPGTEHGVTLYSATRSDLEEFAEEDSLLPCPGVVPVATQ